MKHLRERLAAVWLGVCVTFGCGGDDGPADGTCWATDGSGNPVCIDIDGMSVGKERQTCRTAEWREASCTAGPFTWMCRIEGADGIVYRQYFVASSDQICQGTKSQL